MLENHSNNIFYVYKHTFNNGVIYIGKGKNKRYKSKSRNSYWKRLCEKYGHPIIDITHNFLCEKDAYDIEVEEIRRYKALGILLCNMTDGGDGMYNPTKEVRLKMSAIHKGKKLTEDHKKALLYGSRNKIFTDEYRLKISDSLKLHIRTDEHNKKIGSSQIGKKLSKSTIDKITIASTGRKHSDETKAKMSNWQIGKKLSNQTKANISKSLQGRTPINKDNSIYKFIHINGEIIICDKFKICNMYRFDINCFNAMVRGRNKQYKGWIVSKEAMPLNYIVTVS